MKANETRVEDFLSQNRTQFVIPVYQRNYDWTINQCKQLLDDILEAGSKDSISAHFIGSIVYIHDDVYTSSRVKELTIIDGQQRLTTLTLVYIAIYQLAKDMNAKDLENELIETYLINKYASVNEQLKLRLTEDNEKAIKYLIRNSGSEEFSGYSRLIENFDYFRGRITEDIYEYILKGLSKLMFVEISLDREKDDPQRIFESLNSTGLELSQADLIRNYILMGLRREDQQKIYENYWKVIEENAKDEVSGKSKVSGFIRDYLTLINNKISNKSKVYEDFKSKYPTSSLEELEGHLLPIKGIVKYYNKLLNPTREPDRSIREQLEYINRLEINVAYPFIMKVYEDYDVNKIISKQEFIDVLEFVQSYTWRRFIVGLPTNALNKIFMSIYDKIDRSNYLKSMQLWLLKRKGVPRFPKNSEVIESLKFKDVYNIKSKNRTYLLERLENHQNREPVKIDGNPDITIEHIFPQTPDPKWKVDLGIEDYNFIKENYLHTIANLTLSGNNGKLGNKAFAYKRDLEEAGYKASRLYLNKYLSIIDKWNREEIEARFRILSERFLDIWKLPTINIEDKQVEDEINIFDAENPRHKKLEYAIFFDQKIVVKQVVKLYQNVMEQLFELQPETFFTTDLGEKIGLVRTNNVSLLRQAIPISESYFIEGNIDNVGKFDRMKYALTLLNTEDELLIKYAES